MKRRSFIGATAGAAAALTGMEGCRVEKIQQEKKAPSIGSIAGKTLEELQEQYRYDLFDDFLSFMDKYVIDHELGGFMCNTDRSGNNITTNKSSWYEGRGIWVYSFLYNKVESDPKYLEVARKSVEFILKHKPKGDEFWPGSYLKEGKALSGPGNIYGGLFIANGLSEYSKAVQDDSYWDMAKDILINKKTMLKNVFGKAVKWYNIYADTSDAMELTKKMVLHPFNEIQKKLGTLPFYSSD